MELRCEAVVVCEGYVAWLDGHPRPMEAWATCPLRAAWLALVAMTGGAA